ncbi:MAG: biosynthetic-type acetolactate synthase large subunit [Lachnospiraceae bacterium]|nr:biosynthetic-type acetolactate synthase large subunit [Ruminococcus sp.]MCM1275099.1 biosynthetic-type acetolactate synthase large subunit [Lachnospiraceae bacterium]
MILSGSDIIVECLLEQGADTVFGYPGGAVLNIYDSLYKYSDKIRHIITSHEQGACHAADGFARATGKTGVVIATSGPGATNLTTGIATAYMDSIPLVAITGNVSCALLGLDSFQEVDITGVTIPITKHNFIVKDISKLADTLRLAFKIAGSGRKGPVLVDIPKDITAAKCEYVREAAVCAEVEPFVDDGSLDKVVGLIEKSEKPYIYAGGGVISADAEEELKKFAELCDAPVSCSLMGQGAFDQTDRRYIGMLGMHGTVKAAAALNDCDLFIGIGTRFSDRVIGDPTVFGRNAKIIHIDIDPAEFNKNVEVYTAVQGDVKVILSELCGRVAQKRNIWTDKMILRDFGEPVQEGTEAFPVTPQEVIEKLDELTEGRAVISTEVGQNQMWAAQYYRFRKPRSFVSSGGLGTMGFGLGASIGAKVGCPDRTVVNIAGDGSFAMNLNELITASAHNIPIIEIVINNNVLGMVRQWQRLFYEKHFSQTTLDARHIDYVKLGESFGIKTFVIEKKEDVEPVLKKALEISKSAPCMIEVRIDRDINVLPMIPAGQPVVNPITEIDLEA